MVTESGIEVSESDIEIDIRKLNHPTGLNKSPFLLQFPPPLQSSRKKEPRYPGLLQARDMPGDNNVAP